MYAGKDIAINSEIGIYPEASCLVVEKNQLNLLINFSDKFVLIKLFSISGVSEKSSYFLLSRAVYRSLELSLLEVLIEHSRF